METRVVHAKVKKRLTEIACRICVVQYSRTEVLEESVLQTQRVHPFPFRTRKLSCAVPKILRWRRLGKIGRRQHPVRGTLNGGVAQLGEHLPCKQGVMGSIPIISTRPK